jgi:hypothetical protein
MDLQRKNFRGGGGQIGGTADMSGGSSTNQGPAGGASAGGNYGGNVNADNDYGGKSYRDQSYATQESINRADNRAAQREVQAKQRQAEIAEEQRKKNLGTGPLKSNLKPSYYQNFKNKLYQNSIKRNKVLAMRQLGLMKKGLPGLYGNLISGMTGQIPDWAKDFTEEDLMQIATSGPYLGQQNTVADVSRFSEGKDLLGRVTEAQSILDTGNFPQSDYERLFPSNITNPKDDGNPYILPQYAIMGGGADMGSEDVEEKTYDYHLGLGGQQIGANVLRGYQANGGRITRAGGGIMNAVPRQGYFLGGIGKAVGKVVGGVAKAAGKVLSSDVGKMALAAGAFYYGGGGGMPKFMGGKGLGGFSLTGPGSFFSKSNPLLFSAGKFNPMKFAGLTTAIGAMGGPAKVDQMPGDDGTRGGRLIDPLTGEEGTPSSMRANIENAKIEAGGDPVKLASLNQKYNNMLFSILPYENYGTYAQGGRIKAQEGGLMNLGGMEKDYRAEGGFVPIGKQEKADDVPARLSVNEFVFTADAVRNAGGGDIDKGAEVMENMMKNLENGGRVSEESQGNTGAQEMFSVSERIGEVI